MAWDVDDCHWYRTTFRIRELPEREISSTLLIEQAIYGTEVWLNHLQGWGYGLPENPFLYEFVAPLEVRGEPVDAGHTVWNGILPLPDISECLTGAGEGRRSPNTG